MTLNRVRTFINISNESIKITLKINFIEHIDIITRRKEM
jgi:hypothetical protein